MKKKGVKGSHKKEEETESHVKNESAQKLLIENFVALQSVITDLSSKLNNLANQISKLLELFEESAKTFMEKDLKIGGADKELADKIDKILEQNKIIARGLALLHEANIPQPVPETGFAPQPFTQQIPRNPEGINGYQKSISQ